MEKQQKCHRLITEFGNLQLRIVTQYLDDTGKIILEGHGCFYPADPRNMKDLDAKSQILLQVITDSKVLADFEAEKTTTTHPIKLTGKGIERSVSYDRVIDDLGRIAVRRITRVFDDGKEVGKTFHRSWIIPGNIPNIDVISNAIAKKIHTPDVIQAYKDRIKEK